MGFWKQTQERVVMMDPNPMPADEFTQGDIPLGLTQNSLRTRAFRVPHRRHIRDEKK
jgi:hypothetical protein